MADGVDRSMWSVVRICTPFSINRPGEFEDMGTTADESLDPDAKEALLMATLAWSFDHGLPGNLPEVTGARAPVVLGTTTS